MSSGGAEVPAAGLVIMLAVPAAAPVLAAAVVAAAALAAAGAVAVLAARAAAAGGEALAAGMVRIGELVEAQQEAYVSAQEAADLWQLGVAQVVDRNARIAAMAATARSLGRDQAVVAMPRPFDVAGKSLCEMRDWCLRVDEQLAHSRGELDKAVAAAAGQRLTASLPPGDVTLVSAERMLAEHEARIAAAAGPREADATSAHGRGAAALAEVARQVRQRLAELDPDARPEDYARALEAAARAETSPLADARTHAEHVGIIVAEANRKAREAREAARLLQGMTLDPLPCDLDEQDRAVVAGLESVVSRTGRLDASLAGEAQRVLCKVEAAGARQYLREQVRQIMEANGYEVEGDFTTLRSGADSLTLSRPEPGWAEHHLRLVLDEGGLRYLTLRDHKVAGDDAARVDGERCAQVAADVRVLGDTLRSRGTDVKNILARDDPPVQYLAGAPAADRTARARATQPGQAALPLPDADGGSR